MCGGMIVEGQPGAGRAHYGERRETVMESIVSYIGAFFRHIIGVLLLCWRRMLRAGLIAFAFGVTLALLVAVIATGQAFPGALALAVALVFGAVLAYCVALTVLIEEFLLGVVDLIRLLEGDVKAVAHLAATVEEREVGAVTQGLRRLIGLPISTRATSAASAPTLPTLPTLPKYPAAPARPVAPGRPTSAPSRAIEASAIAAATAGAAALTARAMANRAPMPSTPPAAAPAAPATDAVGALPPLGTPVPAERLPRIGWTYEHEAIRPTRVAATAAETPTSVRVSDETNETNETNGEVGGETLAELVGVAALAGSGGSLAEGVATDAAAYVREAEETSALAQSAIKPASVPVSDADDAAVTAVVAPAPAASASEPLDVAVVSATAMGALGPIAPAALLDDTSLEDERLAEPETFATQDEATVVEPVVEPAPTELVIGEDQPADAEPLRVAPATTPLFHDAEPLDPAMLAHAPATIPLSLEAEPPAATPDVEPSDIAPTESATESATEPFFGLPVEPSAPRDALEGATLVATLAPPDEPDAVALPVEPAEPAEPVAQAAPEAPAEAPASDEPAAVEESPALPVRSALSRITRPIEDVGMTFATLNRAGAATGPRASAPESGLWERLSQALIERSGAPSGPFAAPLSPHVHPSGAPDDATISEADESPQG